MTLGLSSLIVSAGSGSTTVAGGTTYKLLPESGGRGYPVWQASTAYAQGDMVLATTNGMAYMCVVPGTSSNSATAYPVGMNDFSDGTSCVWRVALAKPRKLMVVCNDGTGTVYLTEFQGASGVGKGARLNASGGAMVISAPGDDVPQGAIYAISAGASSISHYER